MSKKKKVIYKEIKKYNSIYFILKGSCFALTLYGNAFLSFFFFLGERGIFSYLPEK